MARSPQEERRQRAWIGGSLVIRGDLTSSEDMTIAGRVEGDVSAQNNALILAEGARILGDVTARTVTVQGHVTGSIVANSVVEIGETGSVDGDVRAPSMRVTEGARLHGRLRIGSTRGSAAGPSG